MLTLSRTGPRRPGISGPMPTGNIGVTKLFYYVMVGTAAVYKPPGDDGLVFSGAVVWVLRDQSRVTVPEAVQHLMATAVPQREETAVLCSIPRDRLHIGCPLRT